MDSFELDNKWDMSPVFSTARLLSIFTVHVMSANQLPSSEIQSDWL